MPLKRKRLPRHHRPRSGTLLFLSFFFPVLVFVPHMPLLDVPFFWDELGQFVPAALDLYKGGYWIPRSATPNVHPPGVMAYLAGVWILTGYSIEAARAAMLAMASVAILVVFLLAVELCRDVKGLPALAVAIVLCASPLFFTQSMMVQLDMPAMLFTALALLFFVKEKLGACVLSCCALVLTKETGAIVPLTFGLWLAAERRFRHAMLFTAPLLVLCAWLLALGRATGHVFGNSEFTRFNVFYLMHPVRMAAALGKRLYYVFAADAHWIATIGLLIGLRRRVYAGRAWKLIAVLTAAHVIFFSLLGGAMLERYLLPVLPMLYIGAIAGWCACSLPWRIAGQGALLAGLVVSLFWNPPYPFPYENNLAFTDFARLQQETAQFIERRYPVARVTTAWPFTAALQRPEFGYARQRHPVHAIPDFRAATVQALDPASVRLFVLYSREWEPEFSLMRLPGAMAFWRRFFGYQPQITPAEVQARFGLKLAGSWSRRGQWIEVYVRPDPADVTYER